jgi:putative tryptophan/tyrosine transport system substrate-binding protein
LFRLTASAALAVSKDTLMALGRLLGRRKFLAGVGNAVVLRSLSAVAEQTQQTRRIGVLVGLAPNEDAAIAQAFIRPFRESMRSAGWIEGGNIQIDYRFGGPLADLSKTKMSAAELVAVKPDVIYSQGLPATLAVHQLTATIPIVFTQLIDPVGFGLAEGLGHPGGNVTGFVVWDFPIAGKWVQLLRELVPDLVAVGILFNPDTAPYAPGLISAARDADRNVRIVECRTHNDTETEAVLTAFASEPRRALLVIPEPFTNGHRDHVIALCARLGLPAINSVLGAKDNGALLSYTFVWDELIRAQVGYIDRILKGALPRDLPIQAPRRYELVINLKTAKALNLEVPPGLLARADEVIE